MHRWAKNNPHSSVSEDNIKSISCLQFIGAAYLKELLDLIWVQPVVWSCFLLPPMAAPQIVLFIPHRKASGPWILSLMQYGLSNNENSEQVIKIINHARSGGYEISSNLLRGAVLPAQSHMAFHGHQPIYESWNIIEYCWKLWDHEKLSTARHGEWYKLARSWSYILLQKWNQTALARLPVYKTTNHEDNSLIRTNFFFYLYFFF